jgi:hypothetical protein
MSAENLLLLLDECDEINIVIREFLRPATIFALACLLVAFCVGWRTGSVALTTVAIVTSAWLGLVVNWLRDRARPMPVAVTPRPADR